MREIKITIRDTGGPTAKVRIETFVIGGSNDREDNVSNTIMEALLGHRMVRSIKDLMPGRIGEPADKSAAINALIKAKSTGKVTVERIGKPSLLDRFIAFCNQFKG